MTMEAEERGPETVVKVEEDTARATSAEELIERSDLTADHVAAAEEIALRPAKGKALVTLFPSQKELVTARRKFIALMACRQYGKTFISTLRVTKREHEDPHPYYELSRSERQSQNAIAQTAVHCRAVEKAAAALGKRIGKRAAYSTQRLRAIRADGSEGQYTRLKIELPNGGKIIGLPSSPDTVVGIYGSIYFDEYAVQKNQRELWGRLFAVVSTKPVYEMLMSSTPRGKIGKWYEIMTSHDYDKIFHRIVVDIRKAVAEGKRYYDSDNNPVLDEAGIERLRLALKDDDLWAEEYLCAFNDDELTLLNYDLIGRCESLHRPDGKPYEILFEDFHDAPQFDPTAGSLAKRLENYLIGEGEIYVGHDIARTRDLSVIWIDQEHDGRLWQVGLIVMRNKDFEFQEQVLWQFLDLPRCRKAGIDATGMGSRTAERAVTRYGGKVVAVNFASRLTDRRGETHAAKALLARTILERHQTGSDRYPVRDDVRDDLHRVKRKRSSSPDAFTYFADDDASGHADIFTSKALADVVYQELREFGGRVLGMRVGADPDRAPEAHRLSMRPDHDWTGQHANGGAAELSVLVGGRD